MTGPFADVADAINRSANVDLGELLDETIAFHRRYVSFSNEHQPVVIALWTAHAHAIAAADVTGYLHVFSAEKRSGKTRELEVTELLVPSPIRASTLSASAVFRLLEGERRTFLFDEADATFTPKSDREELRAILNAGYRRGSPAWRVEVSGKTFTPTPYEAFGAKMIASIGRLPDTIEDRSIPVELRRRRPTDRVERFRYREARAAGDGIKARLEAWCTEDVIKTLAIARPRLPDLENDRALDSWEPLCAIAELAGGAWPERARAAAEALHGSRSTDDGHGVATLRAIRDLFEKDDVDRLPTEDVLVALAARDDGPWSYWFADDLERARRDGRPALKSARKLARTLADYDIEPTTIKMPGGTTPRGYLRDAFEDAWSRYVPVRTDTTATTETDLTSGVVDVPEVAVPTGNAALTAVDVGSSSEGDR